MKGRKRHIAVDSLGLLLSVVVHVARCQDRDGARPVLARMKGKRVLRKVRTIFADAGYTGGRLAEWAKAFGSWTIEIVKRTELHKFVVLPKRRIVERTPAWLGRCRRLSKDYEERPCSGEALVNLAMTHLMIRRLQPAS